MPLIGLLAAPLMAQDAGDDPPSLIRADQITYDEELGVATATGHVEISRNGRVLLADSVTFNTRSHIVTASGNVSLLEADGKVYFADFVELTDDLREGFIRNIRVLLTDRSRLAAVTGLRTGGNKTVFSKAVFSPCDLCIEDPTRAPLWQLKALEVEHDEEDKVIRYRDAWMEIYGVPVIYTPYLQHPDPTVKRKSGFLSPTVGGSKILGTTYQQPYFWAIDTDKDATIAPILTTEKGVVLAAEYRQLLPNGTINLRGSSTVTDRTATDGTIEPDVLRGHIDGTVRLDLDRTWRGGIDIQRSSDDTYMRIYNFASSSTLTSRGFVEGFNGRNYLSANGYLFQSQRAADRQVESPRILPLIDYNYVGEPGLGGGRYALDGNLMALTRREGRDSYRVSTAVGWDLPYIGRAGEVYGLTARVQGDGYWVDGVAPGSNEVNPTGSTVSGVTGRLFPQLAANVRYPWVRHSGGLHQVIEPVVQAVAAPGGSNPDKIPNEDSLDFEFDDTNLFSLNRFPGLDRVDSGTRVDYGLKAMVTGDGGGYTSAFIGQSFRVAGSSFFAKGSGVEDDFSDIVGRVQIKPSRVLDLVYRFRLDNDDFTAHRNEVDLRVGPPILNLDLDYIFVDDPASEDELADREELTWTLKSQITPYWSLFGGQRQNLALGETRDQRIGATYQDECIQVDAVATRSFFSDREIEPEFSFFVNVVFKYLGGVSTSNVTSFTN